MSDFLNSEFFSTFSKKTFLEFSNRVCFSMFHWVVDRVEDFFRIPFGIF